MAISLRLCHEGNLESIRSSHQGEFLLSWMQENVEHRKIIYQKH